MNVVDDLKAARDLISNQERWTTTWLARDKAGVSVSPRSPKAVCWCAYGAILKTANSGAVLLAIELEDAARQLFDSSVFGHGGISDINDKLGHAAVLQAYDKAIEDAENAGKKQKAAEHSQQP